MRRNKGMCNVELSLEPGKGIQIEQTGYYLDQDGERTTLMF